MMELDEILKKWATAKASISEMEKKMEHYKKLAEKQLTKMGVDQYANSEYKVKKQTQQRSVMVKKMVPAEVWDRYSLPQKVEFWTLAPIKNEKRAADGVSKDV